MSKLYDMQRSGRTIGGLGPLGETRVSAYVLMATEGVQCSRNFFDVFESAFSVLRTEEKRGTIIIDLSKPREEVFALLGSLREERLT